MRWTAEHQALRESVHTFVDREINPYADQWEEEGNLSGSSSV